MLYQMGVLNRVIATALTSRRLDRLHYGRCWPGGGRRYLEVSEVDAYRKS